MCDSMTVNMGDRSHFHITSTFFYFSLIANSIYYCHYCHYCHKEERIVNKYNKYLVTVSVTVIESVTVIIVNRCCFWGYGHNKSAVLAVSILRQPRKLRERNCSKSPLYCLKIFGIRFSNEVFAIGLCLDVSHHVA